ncbi:hypothetical protein [Arthrobacter sp. MMS24-S77]
MTQRSSAHSGRATRAAVRRPFSVALAGIAMAMVMCAFPLLSAHAETILIPGQGQVTPTSPAPAPTEPTPTQPKVADPVPTKPPVVAPAPPAPAAPAPAQAPVPQMTMETEPSVAPSEAPAASSPASPSASPTTSTASPSASSNWDTPIQDGQLKATQAAAVSGAKGPGSDMFGVIAIMGGVLLVAAGGIAFALWSRNRFSH